jgi:geranylgeranyl diphosphate synthase type II
MMMCFLVADDILDVTSSTEVLGKTAGKDENVHKATYVRLLGLEKSKNEAERLIQEAKQALSKFGEKADPLYSIADFVVGRSS